MREFLLPLTQDNDVIEAITPDRSDDAFRAEAGTGTGAVFVREAVVDIEVLGNDPFGVFAWRQGRVTDQPSDTTR